LHLVGVPYLLYLHWWYTVKHISSLEVIFENRVWRQHIPLHHLFTYKTIYRILRDKADKPHSKNLKINIGFKFSGHHRDIIENLCFSVKWCVTGCFQTFQKERIPFIILWNVRNHLNSNAASHPQTTGIPYTWCLSSIASWTLITASRTVLYIGTVLSRWKVMSIHRVFNIKRLQ
jgi:hypothetical protein